MLMDGWTGSLLCLSRLDAGFLIRTDDPDALLEQGRSLFIQVKDWASTHQKLLGLLNMLPTMVAPGTDLLGGEPAANGAGRDLRQGRGASRIASQLNSTPTSQRHSMSARQATGQRRDLSTHMRGETAGRSRSGGILKRMCLRPAASPLPDETSFEAKRLSELLGTPAGMGMSGEDNLGAFGHRLRRPARLSELAQ